MIYHCLEEFLLHEVQVKITIECHRMILCVLVSLAFAFLLSRKVAIMMCLFCTFIYFQIYFIFIFFYSNDINFKSQNHF